jgi:hypothetical protein
VAVKVVVVVVITVPALVGLVVVVVVVPCRWTARCRIVQLVALWCCLCSRRCSTITDIL